MIGLRLALRFYLRPLLFLLFFSWVVVVVFYVSVMRSTEETLRRRVDELQRQLAASLARGEAELTAARLEGEDRVREESAKLNRALEELEAASHPSIEHELARFRVERGVAEAARFFHAQLGHCRRQLETASAPKGNATRLSPAAAVAALVGKRLAELSVEGRSHFRALKVDLAALRDADGNENWRRKEMMRIGNLVQERLDILQNPENCKKAKKLVCEMKSGCGFGCQFHYVMSCLVLAYASQRTLVLESAGWHYSPKKGWEGAFLPISRTCTVTNAETLEKERSKNGKPAPKIPIPVASPFQHKAKGIRELKLPFSYDFKTKPVYMPLAVPEDLRPTLERIHGDPSVWWLGQIAKYLFKPQTRLREYFESLKSRLGFSAPVVGIHVRRTDKLIVEAQLHDLSEYMGFVSEWFERLEATRPRKEGVKRKVYLATDEPNVLREAEKRYSSDYKFFYDYQTASGAKFGRYSESSLDRIVADVVFLANCDFLVCTFSSQVCRLAYEIMQSLRPDASANFVSLDDIYYFGGQREHRVRAIRPHEAKKGQIELQVGDLIKIDGNHWDGFSIGTNLRTHFRGRFPSFKVEDHVEWVRFPVYGIELHQRREEKP